MPTDVIYKYPLLLAGGEQRIAMPSKATIVHVQEQHGDPTLWAKVPCEPQSHTCIRTFLVVATGEEFPAGLDYIGTIHLDWTVWHVLEEVGF